MKFSKLAAVRPSDPPSFDLPVRSTFGLFVTFAKTGKKLETQSDVSSQEQNVSEIAFLRSPNFSKTGDCHRHSTCDFVKKLEYCNITSLHPSSQSSMRRAKNAQKHVRSAIQVNRVLFACGQLPFKVYPRPIHTSRLFLETCPWSPFCPHPSSHSGMRLEFYA